MNSKFNLTEAMNFLVWCGYDYDEVVNLSEYDIFTFYHYEYAQQFEQEETV